MGYIGENQTEVEILPVDLTPERQDDVQGEPDTRPQEGAGVTGEAGERQRTTTTTGGVPGERN